MTLVRWIVQVLVIVFLVRLAMRLIAGGGARRGPRSSRPAAKPAERIGGALVRDPQCGTYLPKDRALAHGRGDATQYFCSTTCRDAWLAVHDPVAQSSRA